MSDTMSDVMLVIYKKIVYGDLKKFYAKSNDEPSGGGARDLRFSPATEFMKAFEKMFSPYKDGILQGYFSWENHEDTEVFIKPPTNSRSNEMRIATVNKCFPAQVIPKDVSDCILLIIQDDNGKVWPYFTSKYSLKNDDWHPMIKDKILKGLNAKRSSKISPMGYIDIADGGSFTNGK